MVTCPRCGQQVDQLHPVPPEVITRELLDDMGVGQKLGDLEACSDCSRELMAGP